MIVVDASAGVLALLNDGAARSLLTTESLAAPHLVDSEVAEALRSQILRGEVNEAAASKALAVWIQLGITRFATVGLLDRAWELRDNVTAYDATYVALAEALGCALVTADGPLSRAPGPQCTLTVVRD